jgi:hypothetical protein
LRIPLLKPGRSFNPSVFNALDRCLSKGGVYEGRRQLWLPSGYTFGS